MAKLTKAQREALYDLSETSGSSYQLGYSLSTLYALERRGYAYMVPRVGNIAFPHSAKWRITEEGRRISKVEAP